MDEGQVGRELVADTVCGLDRESILLLVAGQDGATPNLDSVRDAVITLDEQIELWRQSLGLDPRIDASVAAAEDALAHWRRAVYFADQGKPGKAQAQMDAANRKLQRIDQERPSDLCPR